MLSEWKDDLNVKFPFEYAKTNVYMGFGCWIPIARQPVSDIGNSS
jgi:hypothetical protein